ncbi:uncharacterized protein LOC110908286 isoform X2 [Helianthus annuus]|uniref:uncharacterized protein LOC110908286 isoform X2 n=1 Tax=Helianthus annuus TaxID=4232 RepID=UPI001653086C|nr:uncharacterized protein LOC110908286 isoform X2 [Helianthus annuus]
MALDEDLQLNQSLTLIERHALLEEIYNQLAQFPIPPPIELNDLPDDVLSAPELSMYDPAPLLPRFTGAHPNKWLAYAERYFTFYKIHNTERFPYVLNYFYDEAAMWLSLYQFTEWSDFIVSLNHRFGYPVDALQVFDEMPDRIELQIVSSVHETIDDMVLEIQTDSMVDVHASLEVTDSQMDISDYIFVLERVKPYLNIVLADVPKENDMVETNVGNDDSLVDSMVINSFAWKPGWVANHVQVSPRKFVLPAVSTLKFLFDNFAMVIASFNSPFGGKLQETDSGFVPTPPTVTIVCEKHNTIGTLGHLLSGSYFGPDGLRRTFSFDPGPNSICTTLCLMPSIRNSHPDPHKPKFSTPSNAYFDPTRAGCHDVLLCANGSIHQITSSADVILAIRGISSVVNGSAVPVLPEIRDDSLRPVNTRLSKQRMLQFHAVATNAHVKHCPKDPISFYPSTQVSLRDGTALVGGLMSNIAIFLPIIPLVPSYTSELCPTSMTILFAQKYSRSSMGVVMQNHRLSISKLVLLFQVDDKRIRWKGGTLPIILVLDSDDVVFDVWHVYDLNNNRSDIIIAIGHDQFTWAPQPSSAPKLFILDTDPEPPDPYTLFPSDSIPFHFYRDIVMLKPIWKAYSVVGSLLHGSHNWLFDTITLVITHFEWKPGWQCDSVGSVAKLKEAIGLTEYYCFNYKRATDVIAAQQLVQTCYFVRMIQNYILSTSENVKISNWVHMIIIHYKGMEIIKVTVSQLMDHVECDEIFYIKNSLLLKSFMQSILKIPPGWIEAANTTQHNGLHVQSTRVSFPFNALEVETFLKVDHIGFPYSAQMLMRWQRKLGFR